MKSMTGYGRGECARDGFKVTVELSSVNRKQTEIALALPRELDVLESRVRDLINSRIARGRVTARVTLHAAGTEGNRGRINAAVAAEYARDFRKLAKDLKLGGEVTLDAILRAPGVIETDAGEVDAEAVWPGVEAAVGKALDALVKMREREGKHLATDLRKRIAALGAAVKNVRTHAPVVQARYREQLLERVRAAGVELANDHDERVLKELVFYSDRSDITEELTRLQSHFQQFEDCVKSGEPVGRTLDFLSQEMNREINTIGAKANSSEISREVVNLKTELEKFREQVQNLE